MWRLVRAGRDGGIGVGAGRRLSVRCLATGSSSAPTAPSARSPSRAVPQPHGDEPGRSAARAGAGQGGAEGCADDRERRPTSGAAIGAMLSVGGRTFVRDAWTSVSLTALGRLGAGLLQRRNHPLRIVRRRIEEHYVRDGDFALIDDATLSPVVTVEQNFDSLLFPPDHPARRPSDTYYLNRRHLLRCHMTAHQTDLLRSGQRRALFAGDVFRRDEIDAYHYPAFHQLDGICLYTAAELNVPTLGSLPDAAAAARDAKRLARESATAVAASPQPWHAPSAVAVCEAALKGPLERLARGWFGPSATLRWCEAHFPFTRPSWELEVRVGAKWLELLGCGIIQQPILARAGIEDRIGWAFGMGLERLAMVLFDIPDVRLFWSTDERFIAQFDESATGPPRKYVPFSPHEPHTRDISFWLTPTFDANTFFEVVRSVAHDLVERVELVRRQPATACACRPPRPLPDIAMLTCRRGAVRLADRRIYGRRTRSREPLLSYYVPAGR